MIKLSSFILNIQTNRVRNLSFKHAWISLPVRGFWKLQHSLISFNFIFLFSFLLIPTPPPSKIDKRPCFPKVKNPGVEISI